MAKTQAPHIVVLGAGFGGLNFCQHFRHSQARITLVDKQNHHLFQPLLYQVATSGLSPTEIAQPIRSILARRDNITVLMDEATGMDLKNKTVILEDRTLAYDYLVIALGGVTSYFGHPEWEKVAPGLKSLEDAIRIRHEVLWAFEKAEMEEDPAVRDRLMTIVIVGGGPTGVELAGAFADLARQVLSRDFRRIEPRRTRVILIEGDDVVLGMFPRELSLSARRQLEKLGVEVRTGHRVRHIEEGKVHLDSGEILEAANIVWGAGVAAHPLTRDLGVPVDRAGRLQVESDLSLPGHPEVFAIGDLAGVQDASGRPVPGVAPAAMQMAKHVAQLLEDELALGPAAPSPRPAFRYWDKGTMATIGRSAAVAWAGPVRLSGFIAWLAWLLIHLLFLVGLRNKAAVVLQWIYAYFAYKRGARIISSLKLLEE